MKSTPIEVEKLGLVNVGYLAQKRLARGLRLNCTEAVALIATQAFVFMFVCWSLFVMVIIDSGRIDGSWETTPWKVSSVQVIGISISLHAATKKKSHKSPYHCFSGT
ncbi:urease subunit gamma-like isoform X2 [Tripterygium wilfordii]|uniref:urease subunit gamma-like isoform X2 n=1 Tax=Tripterygium wilfordii TaxID=458696 RepID=UPI0018F84C51|nr:urease subunit gamma-like isoform X2 [Tripterygium wilfordii]